MKPQLTIEKADFRGWQAVHLGNNLIRLVAVPDIGGRVMAYDLDGYPFLFVDPTLAGKLFSPQENQGDGSLAAWKNYGGDKTWPSPQGWETDEEWHGPPDPVLDTGRYTLQSAGVTSEGARLEMVSPPDTRTGVQITRSVTLPYPGSTRVRFDLSFKNISDRPIRWSIWDVVQLRAERNAASGSPEPDTSCCVTAPINTQGAYPQGFYVMFGDPANPQWTSDLQKGLFVANYQWEIGKVGIDASAGWIAFSNRATGYAFTEQFQLFPGQTYPDQGVSLECWTVGKGQVANLDYEKSGIYLMETEVLSPFYTFQPGESRSFTIEWGATRCGGMVIAANPGGVIVEPLQANALATGLQLTGKFGVYERGALQLTWKNAAGDLLAQVGIETVDPRQPIVLDMVFPVPVGAVSAQLEVASHYDQVWRLLDQVSF